MALFLPGSLRHLCVDLCVWFGHQPTLADIFAIEASALFSENVERSEYCLEYCAVLMFFFRSLALRIPLRRFFVSRIMDPSISALSQKKQYPFIFSIRWHLIEILLQQGEAATIEILDHIAMSPRIVAEFLLLLRTFPASFAFDQITLRLCTLLHSYLTFSRPEDEEFWRRDLAMARLSALLWLRDKCELTPLSPTTTAFFAIAFFSFVFEEALRDFVLLYIDRFMPREELADQFCAFIQSALVPEPTRDLVLLVRDLLVYLDSHQIPFPVKRRDVMAQSLAWLPKLSGSDLSHSVLHFALQVLALNTYHMSSSDESRLEFAIAAQYGDIIDHSLLVGFVTLISGRNATGFDPNFLIEVHESNRFGDPNDHSQHIRSLKNETLGLTHDIRDFLRQCTGVPSQFS